MRSHKKPLVLLLALILLLTPILSACSVVSVVETTADEDDEPSVTAGIKTAANTTAANSTATETTAETTAATTAAPEPPPEPPVLEKKTVPDDPYTPVVASPVTSPEYEELVADVKNTLGASEVADPARTVGTYARKLPLSCSPDRAETREELIEIAEFHAFYRESGFTVTLGYAASDAEAELKYICRKSELLPSLCSVSGTLSEGVLSVSLIFYPETYLVTPRDVVEATVLGGENTPPNGTDTLPGLDPDHGVSVWDSEQMAYALSRGYAVSPIEGSPAATLAEAARTILAGIVDDTMSEFQIAYRVYRRLVELAAYDYTGDKQASRSLDPAYLPDMIPARIVSFKAEGPLLYGVGVCFGYAKAATVLLGLEGLDAKRVVSFSEEYLGWMSGRPWALGDSIQVHSYNYLRIDGHDYLFDLSFAKDGKLQVRRSDDLSVTDVIGATKDFCVGLSKAEQCTYYSEFPDDPYSLSSEYNPGSFHYLSEITYDGTHSLLLSTQAEAQAYYDYLLANVFSGAKEYRTVTLFFADGAYEQSALNAFLAATGVPYKTSEKNASFERTDAVRMIQIAFGK